MLRTILVPLDGSALSASILGQVRRILVRRDARVVLLRVVPERELGAARGADPVAAARAELEEQARALRAQGAQAETRVLAGDPAERVLSAAAEIRPDLIALSTHGRSGPSRWIRGSTAERILRGSSFPTVVANPRGLDCKETRFAKILVALDGSEQASSILPQVVELAKLYDAEVTLLNAIETLVGDFSPGDLAVAAWNDAEAFLEAERAKLQDELPASRLKIKVVPGPAAAAIVDVAAEMKADLLALTTHGRTGASRWLWGSVAEQVVRHAPCPLLVHRTTRAPAGDRAEAAGVARSNA
jgi:nucleotide-binding universal stress UspA family protein